MKVLRGFESSPIRFSSPVSTSLKATSASAKSDSTTNVAGQSIDSGQVEGACKHMIGRWFKQTGVRRVNHMSCLCALIRADQWTPYLGLRHLASETDSTPQEHQAFDIGSIGEDTGGDTKESRDVTAIPASSLTRDNFASEVSVRQGLIVKPKQTPLMRPIVTHNSGLEAVGIAHG